MLQQGGGRPGNAPPLARLLHDLGGIGWLTAGVKSKNERELRRVASVLESLAALVYDGYAPDALPCGARIAASELARRVGAKLTWVVRHLADLKLTAQAKEDVFLRSLELECRRTPGEARWRRAPETHQAKGALDLECVDSRLNRNTSDGENHIPGWWNLLKGRVVTERPRLAVLLSLYENDPGKIEALCSQSEMFDAEALARRFGWTKRESRGYLQYLSCCRSSGDERRRWKSEHDKWRDSLQDLMQRSLLLSDDPKANAQNLICAADQGEGYAVERTLGAAKEVLKDRPKVVALIRRELEQRKQLRTAQRAVEHDSVPM